MHALTKRLVFLEKASPVMDKVIFIVLVEVGKTEMELNHIYYDHAIQWDRFTDETEQAFRSRALSEAPRSMGRVTMLFARH